MAYPEYSGQLSELKLSPDILNMVSKTLRVSRNIMPIDFDRETGVLTLVTTNFADCFADYAVIFKLISADTPEVRSISFLTCDYDNFSTGYSVLYAEPFTSGAGLEDREERRADLEVRSEHTKLADRILKAGIDANASDIHITPTRNGATKVEFRIDGKIRDSGITMSHDDSLVITNIYKRNAKLEVTNLVGQDGHFPFLGRDFRLSTQPYGGDNESNKVVLRIIGASDTIKSLEELSFSSDEVFAMKRLIHKPSGIVLVCGPTGEGKSTTLYSCLQELFNTTNGVIVTVEDPIEKFIPGIAQTQVRYAENERASLTFSKALRSMLRQDPDVIMVGEIRDNETATVAVQASQTGHLILSTLHVRNSISVFRRLADMGANVSGFAEQIVGITSQRLVTLNCPHCRKKVVSPYNALLREQDTIGLEYGKDDDGNEGFLSYVSTGCEHCHNTGYEGRAPLLEIIAFDNYLRDYFGEYHGLVDIEQYLRETQDFKSLWDKGMERVRQGDISLEELCITIEPDVDLSLTNSSRIKAKSREVLSNEILPESLAESGSSLDETSKKYFTHLVPSSGSGGFNEGLGD